MYIYAYNMHYSAYYALLFVYMSSILNKKERHATLLSLLDANVINSQGELADKLFEHGFNVTQASVSRDLVELGVGKINGIYTRPDPLPTESGFGSVDFETAGENLIVGRCLAGLASAITVRIDGMQIDDIVGTIAGDDTIFIAVKSSSAQERVLSVLTARFTV